MNTIDNKAPIGKINRASWYRFFDGNKRYDYKSLYNAITWAEKKISRSTSEEIRIMRVAKRGHALEIDFVARVRYNRPSPARVVSPSFKGEDPIELSATNGSITTVWYDITVYKEYKEKEIWVSSDQKNGIGKR
jgi:hypothetical protein